MYKIKIEFKYRISYERFIQASKDYVPLSEKKWTKVISDIENEWGKEGKKITTELEKISGLKWKIKELSCYLIQGHRSVSEPLTVAIGKNPLATFDALTHELIHVFISQPHIRKKIGSAIDEIFERHKNESQLTKVHIMIHAIHKKILLDLYGISRVKKEIKRSTHPVYVRAWEIVKEEGHESIVKKIFNI